MSGKPTTALHNGTHYTRSGVRKPLIFQPRFLSWTRPNGEHHRRHQRQHPCDLPRAKERSTEESGFNGYAGFLSISIASP
jgi:hypothetical protein